MVVGLEQEGVLEDAIAQQKPCWIVVADLCVSLMPGQTTIVVINWLKSTDLGEAV